MTDKEKITKLIYALAWLKDECDTNLDFDGEQEGSEHECMLYVEKLLREVQQ